MLVIAILLNNTIDYAFCNKTYLLYQVSIQVGRYVLSNTIIKK